MTTIPPGFLDAILAAPDDDAPRLILADWLDEQGQAERAEFIRVQCELAMMQPDTDANCTSRWTKLSWRELNLFAAACGQQSEWATPAVHNVMIAGMQWVSLLPWFRRGFVESIRLDSDSWLQHANAITAATPLRDVVLTDWPEVACEFEPPHGARISQAWLVGDTPRHVFNGKHIAFEQRQGERLTAVLLRLRWPGLRFTLPSGQRGYVYRAGQSPSISS